MRECMTQVRDLLKAKIQCIWIDTYEEGAVINDLREILSAHIIGMNLQVWSFTEGLKRIPMTTHETQEKANPAMMNPKALFDYIRDVQEAKAYEGRQKYFQCVCPPRLSPAERKDRNQAQHPRLERVQKHQLQSDHRYLANCEYSRMELQKLFWL